MLYMSGQRTCRQYECCLCLWCLFIWLLVEHRCISWSLDTDMKRWLQTYTRMQASVLSAKMNDYPHAGCSNLAKLLWLKLQRWKKNHISPNICMADFIRFLFYFPYEALLSWWNQSQSFRTSSIFPVEKKERNGFVFSSLEIRKSQRDQNKLKQTFKADQSPKVSLWLNKLNRCFTVTPWRLVGTNLHIPQK